MACLRSFPCLCVSEPSFRYYESSRCVCVLRIGQMLEKDVATKLTDIVSVVADHKNLVRVCVLHALTAVCLGVSGTVVGLSTYQNSSCTYLDLRR